MRNTARFRAFIIIVGSLFAQPSQAAPSATMLKDVGFGSPSGWKPAPCGLGIKFAGQCSFKAVESLRITAIRRWGKNSFVPIALYCPNENSGKLVLMSINNDQLIDAMEVKYINKRPISVSLLSSDDNGINWQENFQEDPNSAILDADDKLMAIKIVERGDFLRHNICEFRKIKSASALSDN